MKTVKITKEAHAALAMHKAKIEVATFSEAILDLTGRIDMMSNAAINLSKGVYRGKRK